MTPSQPRARDYALGAVPVFGAALLLYWRTLLPDVGLWDTAEFQAIGTVLGTAHPTGYPTYTLLAWLASVLLQPFGSEAYRADLLSALLMAGAAALLAVGVVQSTRRWSLGLVAGAAFAFTPVAWTWALRADPHALHVFLAALLLVLLGAWESRRDGGDHRASLWLLAAAIVYGLALGNHALTLLLAPGIAVFVLMVAPRLLWQEWRLVVVCVGTVVLVAGLVYLYVPLRAAMDPALEYADPDAWGRFRYVVLGEQFRGSLGTVPALADLIAGMWDELVRNLGLLSILALAGAALGLARQPRLAMLSLLWFGCSWVFASGYANASIERYYLVPLLMAALWVALAADAILDVLRTLPFRPDSATWSRLASGGLVVALLVVAVSPVITQYRALDASDDRRGRDYLEAVFESVEEDAVIISWWSFSTPLWYGQHVEGRRPDITVLDDRDVIDEGYGTVLAAVEAHLEDRPVYVIRLERDLRALAERYVLEPLTSVPTEMYRVVERHETE